MTKVVRLRLSEVLQELGWSQADMARKSGLSKNAVSILCRNPQQISLETIATIARATGRKVEELLVETED